MSHQINSKDTSESSLTTDDSFNRLATINLHPITQVMRYLGIVILSSAYIVVTAVCLIQGHSMLSYLLLPIGIVLLILFIGMLSKITTKINLK